MIIHGTANDSKVSLHLLHLQLHLLFCSHLRWLYSLRRAIRHKLCWDQQIWADLWLSHYLFKVKLGSVAAVLLAWHYWLSKQSGLKNVNNNKNRKPRRMHKQYRWFNIFAAIWSRCLPEELSSPRDWHHPCHRRLWGQQVSFVGHIPTGQRVTNVVGALPAYDMQYTWQCRQLNTFLFSFAIGAKYALASDACIRAKVSVRFKKISGSISNVF